MKERKASYKPDVESQPEAPRWEGWVCLECGNDEEFDGVFQDICTITQDENGPWYDCFGSDGGLGPDSFSEVICRRCRSEKVVYKNTVGKIIFGQQERQAPESQQAADAPSRGGDIR